MKTLVWTLLILTMLTAAACSSLKGALGVGGERSDLKPIRSPFGDYQASAQQKDTMIFRTKKGDGAVEVEIPKSSQDSTDFVIPINPTSSMVPGGPTASTNASRMSRGIASETAAPMTAPMGDSAAPEMDRSFREMPPTQTDREIVRTFPTSMAEDDGRRKNIEGELGLVEPDDATPARETSYLAALDHVKTLYRAGRFEAALIEVDNLITQYQTNPRLYQMRGTLLDRVGQSELALKAWKQALRFDPSNRPLRKFIERREEKASLTGK